MVFLHVKKGESDDFLHECHHTEFVEEVINTVVELHNRRRRLAFVADNMQALSEYGPMRPEEDRGLEGTSDPSGIRVGTAPDPHAVQSLQRCAADARALISSQQVLARVVLTADALNECEMNMRGAITIAYPQGLPAHDVLKSFQENCIIDWSLLGNDYMNVKDATLWFAGKRWAATAPISQYLGVNAKTKVIVRLQKQASGAPVREPAVDKETQKAMMAYYHKKQEEEKRLAEDSQDAYLNSEWANTKQVKQQFHGLNPGSIKWRP